MVVRIAASTLLSLARIQAHHLFLLVKNLFRIRKIYSEVKATAYFNADETANRYFRIMALSSLDLFFTIPLLVYHIIDATAVVGLHPWISWEDTKWGT